MTPIPSQIEQLQSEIVAFRDERNWKQFHSIKDMLISLTLEVSELMELFQWKSDNDIDAHIEECSDAIGEELADVLYWILLLAHDMNIPLQESFKKKMQKNREKYPVGRARNSNEKYTAFNFSRDRDRKK